MPHNTTTLEQDNNLIFLHGKDKRQVFRYMLHVNQYKLRWRNIPPTLSTQSIQDGVLRNSVGDTSPPPSVQSRYYY